jgi:hypothetical protein
MRDSAPTKCFKRLANFRVFIPTTRQQAIPTNSPISFCLPTSNGPHPGAFAYSLVHTEDGQP